MIMLNFVRAAKLSVLSMGLAMAVGANVASAQGSHFFGRWTITNSEIGVATIMSSKGESYRTIDIALCGSEFCGVSVGADRACGKTLFRFLGSSQVKEFITGHGRWGEKKLKIQLGHAKPADEPEYLYVGLGEDSFDFESREGSMPKFSANYKREGEATCFAPSFTTS
jgi:hypothetical protein